MATKYMPPNSIILGVDLVPIKAIPRVITLTEDITTEKCRKRIRDEIKDWKADVVLHDGAPNVGTAWAQDAFTQSELVLSSLKLATEFLAPKGTFVTKVFRSKDYNSLLWVFNQLFERVEATKPPSSRNVSAEIFVVCTGYLAPKRLDPRLLNPTHVFKDLDIVEATAENANKDAGSTRMDKLTPAAFNVFHPDKKRRAREGYEDGDHTLFRKANVMDFITSHDPITILGTSNVLDFQTSDESRALLHKEVTTDDVKASCADLKVLGKKDFKNLLRWRSHVRLDLGLDKKPGAVTEGEATKDVVEVQPLTEEEQMAVDIERMETEAAAAKRKERRKTNVKRQREVQRMQLNMTTPMDVGIETAQQGRLDEGDVVFDLDEVETGGRRGRRVQLSEGDADAYGEDSDLSDDDAVLDDANSDAFSDEEEQRLHDLESNLDALYDEFQNTKLAKDAKHRVKEARKKRDAENGVADKEWGGIGADGNGSDADSDASDIDMEEEQDESMAYLERDPDAVPSDELDSEDEAELENEENVPPRGTKGRKNNDRTLLQDFKAPKKPLESTAKARAAAMWFDQPVFKGLEGLEGLSNLGSTANRQKQSDAPANATEPVSRVPTLSVTGQSF